MGRLKFPKDTHFATPQGHGGASKASPAVTLRAVTPMVLTPRMGVQTLEVGKLAPLPSEIIGLLIGSPEAVFKGLCVYPGIIDPDHSESVRALVESPRGITAISPGDPVAQVILLPALGGQTCNGRRAFNQEQTEGAFLALGMQTRPMMQLIVEGKRIMGLLDTGADRSIIATKDWPPAWPTQASAQQLQGLGYLSTPEVSARHLTWKDDEGHRDSFQPFILNLPFSLWGRDVLAKMEVRLCTSSRPIPVPTDQNLL